MLLPLCQPASQARFRFDNCLASCSFDNWSLSNLSFDCWSLVSLSFDNGSFSNLGFDNWRLCSKLAHVVCRQLHVVASVPVHKS